MLPITSEDSLVRKQQSVNVLQIVPLVLATMLVTVGLAMYMSDASNIVDVMQSVIVVFGGALAGLLLSFTMIQIAQALQLALVRGVYGGSSPRQMIRAMLKVCEVSRRDGLLGVADIRSNSPEIEDVCQLIGEALDESSIRFALERNIAREKIHHQMATDVFLFTAIYSSLFGVLGSLLRYVNSAVGTANGATFLPFVCGASLA